MHIRDYHRRMHDPTAVSHNTLLDHEYRSIDLFEEQARVIEEDEERTKRKGGWRKEEG